MVERERHLLATSLTEAGALVVKGPVTAHARLEMGGRGCIYFASEPNTRIAARADTRAAGSADPYSDGANAGTCLGGEGGAGILAEAVLPEFLEADGTCDEMKIRKAVFEGRSVLR